MISNVLFDLDGTLTDSREGIIRCIQFALEQLEQPPVNESHISDLIGIELHIIFQELLPSGDNKLIEEAIRFYRERFSTIGLFENKVYPGITGLLAVLHKRSLQLHVVTIKPTEFAERIVRHFSLNQWLGNVYGSSLDGRDSTKVELIQSIIRDLKLEPEHTMMVGDRKEDIIAGKVNGTKTIGVMYGYGNKDEIINSTPDYICYNPLEINQALTGH